MERTTYTAIDYNSKENKVIEERIRNYYLPVKNTFEAVLYGRLNIPDSPRGLCADLIDVSRTISREFALVENARDVFILWLLCVLRDILVCPYHKEVNFGSTKRRLTYLGKPLSRRTKIMAY